MDNDPPKKKRNHFHGRVESDNRACAVDGCTEQGEFRAPPIYGAKHGYAKNMDGPGEYRWLCLDHVRAFNQGYDYFTGMNPEQIFEAQHPVRGWDSDRRIYNAGPTVPPAWSDFTDPLDAIGARFTVRGNRPQNVGPRVSTADQKALKTLGLGEDAVRADIRRSYSELVRKYHPDRNGGDRSHEKQLANVIAAYTQLKESSDFQ